MSSIDNGDPPNNISIYFAGVPATSLVVAPNDWVHLACVYDGVAVRFYVDGALRPMPRTQYSPGRWLENPWTVETPGAPVLSINSPYELYLGNGASFVGALDEVAVWSIVRNESEICRDAGGTTNAQGACVLAP